MKLTLGIALVLCLGILTLLYCTRRPAAATPEGARAEQLVREAQSAAGEKRLAAIQALGRLRYEPGVEELVRILPDSRPEIRMALIVTLGQIASPKAAAPLEQLLRAYEWDVRKATAEALGQIRSPSSVAALGAALRDEHPAVAMAAAAGLSRIGAPALETLADAAEGPATTELKAQLVSLQKAQAEADRNYSALKAEEGKAAADAERKYASAKTAEAKAAADAERKSAARKTAEAKAAVEASRESTARKAAEAKAACEALAAQIQPLETRLKQMNQMNQAVAYALGRLDDPRALPPLRHMLSDPVPATRLAAAEGLCQQRDVESAEALIALLKDSDPEVRQGLLKALPKLGEAAVPAFVVLATEGPKGARLSAVKFLSQAKDPRRLPVLFVAQGDSEKAVREAAAAALASVPKARLVELAAEVLRQAQSPAARLKALALLAAAKDAKSAEPLAAVLNDNDPAVRLKAAEILHALGDPRGAEALAAALKNPSPDDRFHAAELLAEWGDARAAEVLLGIACNPPGDESETGVDTKKKGRSKPGADAKRVAEAIVLLGQLGDKRIADYAVTYIKDNVPGLAGASAEALGRLKDPRAYDLLAPLLTQPDFHGREGIATALGFLGDPRAVGLLTELHSHLDVLVANTRAPKTYMESKGSYRLDHNWLRKPIVKALARIGGDQAVEALISIVETTPPHNVQHLETLCSAMGELADVRFVKPLADLLLHDCPEPRIAALEALKKMGPQAVPSLIQELKDPSFIRHSTITTALAEIGAPAAEPLLAALKDPTARVRHGAAWALGQMKEPRAAEPLLGMLADADVETRGSVAWALGNLGEPRAVEPLLRMLKDPQAALRGAAAEALGHLGDARAVPQLEALAHDQDQEVARAARQALKELAEPAKPARAGGKTEPAPETPDP